MGARKDFWMVLMIIMLFNLVAVLSTGSGSSDTTMVSNDINIAKLVTAVSKLNKSNYHLWLGGIATVIMTGKAYQSVKDALKIFKTNCNNSMVAIKANVLANVCKADDAMFADVNSTLYQLVYLTIENTKDMTATRLYAVKNAFEDGIALLKHIYDKLGDGGANNQVLKGFNIMDAKQQEDESPSEFGTRLETLNAELETQLSDATLKAILTRGLHDTELKKFLALEMAGNASMNFAQLIRKIENYVLTCKVANPDEDIDGRLAGVGRNTENGNRRNNNYNRTRNNNNQGKATNCYFCGKSGHYARECFLLLPCGFGQTPALLSPIFTEARSLS